jgi:hypothetical protein
MQVGKDTVFLHWADKYKVIKVSFAAKLKSMVKDLYNLDETFVNGENKGVPIDRFGGITAREIMNIWGDVWVDYVFNTTIPSLPDNSLVVITDCRFANEASAIKKYGGVVVDIIRDTSFLDISPEQRNHISETDLDDYNFDFTIVNDGTLEELYKKADVILQQIKLQGEFK